VTREQIERELTELATLAARAGTAHRLYLRWHEQINDRLDAWEDLVRPAVAP
jgi:hypothetical protein